MTQPPPGPGVTPPFAAPPTEGRSFRLWMALGVAALATVLCCGAGGTALVGLFITGGEAVNEQVQATAGDYFDALREQKFNDAYDLLCDRLRNDETPEQFGARMGREPRITSYSLGDVDLINLTLPADLTYTSGDRDTVRVAMDQDSGSGEFRVCGFEE
ncbi:hypothetical protein [Phytohabitans aurantiacus]|jgi:hypothetical protein|uniref:DUF3887 domain-containing protein n=1 Tax=Phytohabitans aurantiacus TaxID=3016789 RepID=A0ABQ5R823_9ACTN|nr:hypothetical protein [Phytohabitans aurantiacus]GLI01716.1 hypothetical protein Pa4123_69920 [Phytohabitans aurantiacus]